MKKLEDVRFLAVKLVYRKLHKLTLIALTGIAVLISGMQGIVYCKAEDGHAGVKFANGVCYGKLRVLSEAATTSLEKVPSSRGNCGPCVDTPISIYLTRVTQKSNPANPTLQISPTITSAIIPGCGFSKYQLTSELIAALNPTLVCLRTIIILT